MNQIIGEMRKPNVSPIAVVGLYRSGSSALAGVLHRLGVYMGVQFWGNHYEEVRLAERLREFWHEPQLIPTCNRNERVTFLKEWLLDQCGSGRSNVGAKHPLLSLSCPELEEAWGPRTKFIWSWRELDQSIDSIVRARWNWESPDRIQRTLWNSLEEASQDYSLYRVGYSKMLTSPEATILSLVEHLELKCDRRMIDDAISFIESHSASQKSRRIV
ncbi:hypothetical protein [Allorhodopirellula solitaria]|nr:hypothetical protein [Allorhodopirellula solitaria]